MHECRAHLVPCYQLSGCYHELKRAAIEGQALTDEELEFVGFTTTSRATGGGWRSVWAGMSQFELHSELSEEDSRVLAALMGATSADAVRFLA